MSGIIELFEETYKGTKTAELNQWLRISCVAIVTDNHPKSGRPEALRFIRKRETVKMRIEQRFLLQQKNSNLVSKLEFDCGGA